MNRPRICLATLALGLLVAGAASAGPPPLHPNTARYSDRHPAGTTARAEGAELALRALFSPRLGTTAVDLSTGPLDAAGAAPGEIFKVHLKAYDPEGHPRWNRVLQGEGSGSLALTFADLGPGDTLRATALIRGVGNRHSSNVDATVPVRIRPDLAVVDLTVPAQARKGMTVNIAAIVREVHLDVGASANCALYVDGVRVDQATGIWVDAAGSVSCAFAHVFGTGGTHQVTVTAEAVLPADDNPGNNSQSDSIDIVDDVNLSWLASVGRSEDLNRLVIVTSGPFGNSRQTIYQDHLSVSEQVHVSAWSRTRLWGPLRVSAAETGGAITATFTRGAWTLPESWDDANCGGARGQDFDQVSKVTFRIETRGCAGNESTNITYTRYGGQVTFFSRSYMETWLPGSPPTGFWTPAGSWQGAVQGPSLVAKTATSHRVQLAVESDGSRQLADILMYMLSYTWTSPPGASNCTPDGANCFHYPGSERHLLTGYGVSPP